MRHRAEAPANADSWGVVPITRFAADSYLALAPSVPDVLGAGWQSISRPRGVDQRNPLRRV